jgi:hypothetical protein
MQRKLTNKPLRRAPFRKIHLWLPHFSFSSLNVNQH